jgi:acyl transferase domain-containing protein
VLSHGRVRPCVVGSVKTNIGHLDAAAGISGLIKVALVLHHRTLVPSLHFERHNPQIAFDELGLRVGTTVEPWGDAPRNAGVSAFGFGGTNTHVILSAAADVPPRLAPRGPAVLFVSATSPAALVKRLETYADSFASKSWSLQDLAFTLNRRRKHFECRAAVVAWSIEDAATAAREAARAIAAGSAHVVASRDGETRLAALGHRYVNGDSVGSDDVGELLGHGALPPYPWQRRRYWLDFVNEEEPCFK